LCALQLRRRLLTSLPGSFDLLEDLRMEVSDAPMTSRDLAKKRRKTCCRADRDKRNCDERGEHFEENRRRVKAAHAKPDRSDDRQAYEKEDGTKDRTENAGNDLHRIRHLLVPV